MDFKTFESLEVNAQSLRQAVQYGFAIGTGFVVDRVEQSVMEFLKRASENYQAKAMGMTGAGGLNKATGVREFIEEIEKQNQRVIEETEPL